MFKRCSPGYASVPPRVVAIGAKRHPLRLSTEAAGGTGLGIGHFNGPEKLATKFNYPVVYLHATRPRRGYYTVRAEVLAENPKSTKENEILELFTRRLEKDIIDNPGLWLWSHKRWKHTKPDSGTDSEFGILT